MIQWALLFCAAARAVAADYYVDAAGGSDAAAGTSAKTAWQSLEKVNGRKFAPGDRILLRSGSRWVGGLRISSSGAAGRPIVVGRYGNGARPRIDGEGRVVDAVLVENAEYVEVRDLEITNRGAEAALRRGVHVLLDDFGDARGIVLSGLYVHDVNGIQKDKGNGGIILRTQGMKKPSRFDGLLVERNVVWKVDRSGILLHSYYWARERWHPSLRVVIRDNQVEDIGGDGIVVWATDGALVEHNISRDANRRADSYNVGIWPWSSDNAVFQWNEAASTRTMKDGHGFDSDYNSRNTVFQYNYSHDNEGGFILICNDGGHPAKWNSGTRGTVVRHNISRNDRERIFNVSGPVDGALIHDNAVYVGAGLEVQMVVMGDWKGWPKNTVLRGNSFYVEGRAAYGHGVERDKAGKYRLAEGYGLAERVVFEGNRYYGQHRNRPADASGVVKEKVEAPALDWNGPRFDASQSEGFDAFLKAHRQWMRELFEKQFGRAALSRR
ncbi:MAG: right-handed parallel beta-helix repeat-containing protein [Bryobacterales bacterium]|nr:right-handed parallel beta-helix repeat-containing protein [Bryobacterales bacterium]